MNKQAIKQKIETAFANFESAVEKYEDINVKRNDGGWSVGQIADHIIKSTSSDFGDTKPADRPYDKNEQSIKDTFLNFDLKFPAAPNLQPREKQFEKSDLIATLERNKNALTDMIDKEDLTAVCTDIELPGWGNLTRYEFLVLIENHIIRHTKQVTDFIAVQNT